MASKPVIHEVFGGTAGAAEAARLTIVLYQTRHVTK